MLTSNKKQESEISFSNDKNMSKSPSKYSPLNQKNYENLFMNLSEDYEILV